MAMGSDQMAHLDSIEARISERSASSAAGDDLLQPDAPARFATQSDELSPSWTGALTSASQHQLSTLNYLQSFGCGVASTVDALVDCGLARPAQIFPGAIGSFDPSPAFPRRLVSVELGCW